MGCSGSGAKSAELKPKGPDGEVEVGAPRTRPEIPDQQVFQEREQESELSSVVDTLPPEIAKKLSRQPTLNTEKSGTTGSNCDLAAAAGASNAGSNAGSTAAAPVASSGASSGASSKDSSGAAPGAAPWPFARSVSRLMQPRMTHRTSTVGSIDSQRDFAASSQTIIIFDWDDTLCPSTCMRPLAQFDRHGNLKAKLGAETRNELKMLSDIVLPLLRLAQSMGKVVLVTNAKAPWVDISCLNFLPALQSILKTIPIIYALELIKMNGTENFEGCLLKESKARAMREAVSQFYSQYPGQSWKNIVSIGDAYFEHAAIRQVVSEKRQVKPCRTKTIKLLEGPTTAGMVVQLSIIHSWLPQIVRADDDVDIDLSADEETVNKWVAVYGDLHEPERPEPV